MWKSILSTPIVAVLISLSWVAAAQGARNAMDLKESEAMLQLLKNAEVVETYMENRTELARVTEIQCDGEGMNDASCSGEAFVMGESRSFFMPGGDALEMSDLLKKINKRVSAGETPSALEIECLYDQKKVDQGKDGTLCTWTPNSAPAKIFSP